MKLITTEDAAKLLCTSPYTIRRYVRSGKLKASKVGKSYLINPEDIDTMVSEATVCDKRIKATGGE